MELLQNLRIGLRTLVKNPLISLLCVLCLALGIGANAAIFSVVNTVLLRPLPFQDVDSLTMLSTTHREPGNEQVGLGVSPLDYVEWKEQNKVFSSLAALEAASLNIIVDGEPERVEGARVTANWLPTMGVEPVLGRNFRPDEDRPGARANVVLIGYGLWGRRFGSDRDLIGKSVLIDGTSHMVIGVLPQGFQFPYQAEMWTPMGLDANLMPQRTFRGMTAFGRLRDGFTHEQAQAEMDTVAGRVAKEFPDTHADWGVTVRDMREELIGDVRPKLLALLAAVGFVLLIACANVASLLLARAQAQSREIAVRAAIGASRRQIVQQFLIESVLLSLLGGVVGVLIALVSIPPLIALSPVATMNSFFHDIRIDGTVLAFALLISLATGFLFGLVPAFKGTRPDVQSLLKEGAGKGGASPRGRQALNTLVVAEVAIAVVLLVGAGLTIRSLERLQRVDPGFSHTDDVLTLRMVLPDTRYPEGHQKAAFLRGVLEKVRAVPGVESAGTTSDLPVNDRNWMAAFSVEGRPAKTPGEFQITTNRLVTPGYLETLGIPVVEGRGFTATDHAQATGVVLVSEQFANRYWPGQTAVGKRVKRGALDSEHPWLTVVGVVQDVKDYKGVTENDTTWYLPYEQHPTSPWAPNISLAVRADGDPAAVADEVIQAIRAVDRQQPVFAVTTMEDLLAQSFSQKRFSTLLFGLFAGLGLILAAVGLYGVMSYSVTQRDQEIGVRMALGANPGEMLKLVVRQGLVLTVVGLVIGLVVALGLTRFLTSQLYEVSPTDPSTFVAISVVLMAVAVLATYLPARRATRIDPVVVLRRE